MGEKKETVYNGRYPIGHLRDYHYGGLVACAGAV